MKYYDLIHNFDSDIDTIFCDEADLFGLEEYIFVKGEKVKEVRNWDTRIRSYFVKGKEITDWDSRITFYYEDGRAEDYLDNIHIWPIFSEKVKEIFDDLNTKGVQFFPINIKNKRTKENLSRYYVINICNLVEALDLERSEYQNAVTVPSIIIGLTHPVLKKYKVKGVDILRLQEYEESIFISEWLKKAMEKAGITGCSFREVKLS